MRLHSFAAGSILAFSLVASARAQTGTLDQQSPYPGGFQAANFWGNLQWQSQVRAGLSGQLEGVTVFLEGNAGQGLEVRIRIGPGWNSLPPVFTGTATKLTSNPVEEVFVDTTASGIALTPNALFVIEMISNGTGADIAGSYVQPPGAPLYPEPMFQGGPGCFADCGWRLAFKTWMVNDASTETCLGDGTQLEPCPCNNSGSAGHGCENSAGTGGALITLSGTTSPDSIVFTSSGEPATALTVFLQGNVYVAAPFVFGDGLRCVGGVLKRLYVKSASSGTASAPVGADPSVSAQSAALGDPIAPGSQRWYQAYYRDANPTFCPAPTGSTFNITSAIRVQW